MTTATSTVRKSADREGFRQAMSWLHTWAGLILGWLLFAIFLTGTLSFFKNEFNLWMRPEMHGLPRTDAADAQVRQATQRMVPLPMLDISSTQIRHKVARGEPITDLVPAAVARYIARQRLYGTQEKDAAAH